MIEAHVPELRRLCQENIRLEAIGDVQSLPTSVQRTLEKVKEETAGNSAMVLTLALNYGARTEIVEAVMKVVKEIREGTLHEKDIDEENFPRFLHTSNLPDPDLLIRTSGEMRVSNFLLWQIAYAEIWVTDTCWPDFTRRHLMQAIIDFQKRERRYGGLGDTNS